MFFVVYPLPLTIFSNSCGFFIGYRERYKVREGFDWVWSLGTSQDERNLEFQKQNAWDFEF